jgi:hypothetical protein
MREKQATVSDIAPGLCCTDEGEGDWPVFVVEVEDYVIPNKLFDDRPACLYSSIVTLTARCLQLKRTISVTLQGDSRFHVIHVIAQAGETTSWYRMPESTLHCEPQACFFRSLP